MSFNKICQCGTLFEAQRDSAKYCSPACSQIAYRERLSNKKEFDAFQAKKKQILEKHFSFLERLQTDNDQFFAKNHERQEINDEKKREQEMKLKLEQEQIEERLRKLKQDKKEKSIKKAALTKKICFIGGMTAVGILNIISENMQNQAIQRETKPYNVKSNSEPNVER